VTGGAGGPAGGPVGGAVLVVGNNTVDTVYRVPGAMGPDTKRQAEALAVYAGGQAANVAYALALLGLPVRYLGAFGDDDGSALSRRSLAEAGIGTSGCVVVPRCPVHHATVVVDTLTGSRSIVMFKDDRLRLDPAAVTPDLLDGAAVLYLDNHEERASIAAAGLAQQRGIPVVADLETLSGRTLPILAQVDTLIAPRDVLRELTGESDPERLVRAAQLLGPHTVVATAGVEGAFGVEATGGIVHVPSRPAELVDSTGAGDAFHAGYLAAFLAGAGFPARLRFGALVAAAKCGVGGPRLTPASVRAVSLPATAEERV
jgi:sugar/nucleoside kinase (ribokinase family)